MYNLLSCDGWQHKISNTHSRLLSNSVSGCRMTWHWSRPPAKAWPHCLKTDQIWSLEWLVTCQKYKEKHLNHYENFKSAASLLNALPTRQEVVPCYFDGDLHLPLISSTNDPPMLIHLIKGLWSDSITTLKPDTCGCLI